MFVNQVDFIFNIAVYQPKWITEVFSEWRLKDKEEIREAD